MEPFDPYADKEKTKEWPTTAIEEFMLLNFSVRVGLPNGLIGNLYGPVAKFPGCVCIKREWEILISLCF